MIIRTYGCEACGHFMEVELRTDQWDQEPPECPRCSEQTHQEFAPVAITGSNVRRATDIAYNIAERDYGVADMTPNKGGPPTVRYKDAQVNQSTASTWSANQAALEQAVVLGRENRLRYGSGLEALQTSLRNGSQPDLIEMSKRRSIRGW
jgi:hypothetical protein